MAIKVSSFDEVSRLISRNPLRNFPSQAKGRDRLFPYARPRVTGAPCLSEDARFFLIGACFARSLGNALADAGRCVLSVQGEEDVPGVVREQFNRYNVFNLDVGMNEVKWALEAHDSPIDAALVEVRGQWIDSQKHWAFAYPRDEARQYRRAYNRSYAGIADADVVVLALASHRQWFDNETGIYINTMPARSLTSAYPGRFELHEFDPAAAADRLRAAVDTIGRLCPRRPEIFVCIAPVWHATSLTDGDSLSDELHSRAVQRVAAETVVGGYPNVHYLPALEAALLGDFDLNFITSNPTHNTQNLADRVIADLLADTGATDEPARVFSVRAHAEASLAAGDAVNAGAMIEAYCADPSARVTPALVRTHTNALRRSGRKVDAVAFVISTLLTASEAERAQLWRLALELSPGLPSDVITALRQAGLETGMDVAELDQVTRTIGSEERELRTALAQFARAVKAGDQAGALELAGQLFTRREAMPDRQRAQFDVSVLRIKRKTLGDAAAIDHALSLLDADPVNAELLLQSAVIASTGRDLGRLAALQAVVDRQSEPAASDPTIVKAANKLKIGAMKAAHRALHAQPAPAP